MERNEQDIFDELVRQKLSGYTEPPEPAWIKNIHAKKNRVINLYHLYRLMLITALVGAGMFSSIYYFVPQQAATSNAIIDSDIVIAEPGALQPIDNTEYVTAFSDNHFYSRTGTSAKHYSPNSNNHSNQSDRNLTLTNNHANTGKVANANKADDKFAGTRSDIKASNTSKSQAQQAIEVAKAAKQVDKISQPDIRQNEEAAKPARPSNLKDSVSLNPDKTKDETVADKGDEDKVTTCNAAFEYYTSYNGEVSFTNTSIVSNGANMTWTFGDGESSIHSDPSHSFTKTGSYKVTLHVKDTKLKCEDSFTKTIAFHNPEDKNVPVAITGIVYAGGSVVKNGFVELFIFDEIKGGYVAAKTVKTTLAGEFSVPIEKGKRYLLKGNPTASQPDYSSTFWGNTIDIEDASDIMAMLSEDHDLLGYNIDLKMGEKPIADDELNTGNPFADASQSVLLLDKNNNIVSVGTVDANGNFSFGNIDPGEYTVVNPATGATSPKTVGAAGTAKGNINAGGGSKAPSSDETVTVFPNPANTLVNFGINSLTDERATIVIMNAGGVELSREIRNFTSGFNQAQYDLSSYPPGIYYVLVFKGNQQVLSNRLVKLSDNTK
jgi:K+-transporting ATPase c subunit